MEQQKTKRVAVVQGDYTHIYHEKWVPEGVVWCDVTEDDYKALHMYCNYKGYLLLEPVAVADILGEARKMHANYLEDQKKQEEQREKQRQKQARNAHKRTLERANKERDEVLKAAARLGLKVVPEIMQ